MPRTRSFAILDIDPAHNTSSRTKARKATHSLSLSLSLTRKENNKIIARINTELPEMNFSPKIHPSQIPTI
jgi:hypothetical protein